MDRSNAGTAARLALLGFLPQSVVSEGDEMIVVEAMKMEIPVEAPMAGTVAEVLVAVGQRVAEGDSLLVLQ